jgi:hypothetical protein
MDPMIADIVSIFLTKAVSANFITNSIVAL